MLVPSFQLCVRQCSGPVERPENDEVDLNGSMKGSTIYYNL